MSWQERAFARRQAQLLHSDLFGSSSSDDEGRLTVRRIVATTSSSTSDDDDRGTRVIEQPRTTTGLGAVDTDLPEPEPEPQAVDSFSVDTAANSGEGQACSSFGVATVADLRRRRVARAARNRHRVEQTANRRHQAQLAGKSSLPRFDATLSGATWCESVRCVV